MTNPPPPVALRRRGAWPSSVASSSSVALFRGLIEELVALVRGLIEELVALVRGPALYPALWSESWDVHFTRRPRRHGHARVLI